MAAAVLTKEVRKKVDKFLKKCYANSNEFWYIEFWYSSILSEQDHPVLRVISGF